MNIIVLNDLSMEAFYNGKIKYKRESLKLCQLYDKFSFFKNLTKH